jgi:hypothetical protein
MILPSDPLVIPKAEIRLDFLGWSDPTRFDGARYQIHGLGSSTDAIFVRR